MIKIIKNRGQVKHFRDSEHDPKYLLMAKSKDGNAYYARIGVREILYYIRMKIRNKF